MLPGRCVLPARGQESNRTPCRPWSALLCQYLLQHPLVITGKLGHCLVKECHRLSDGANSLSQNAALTQGVIAADADDQVRGIRRQPVQLSLDVTRHMTIDSQERCPPNRR